MTARVLCLGDVMVDVLTRLAEPLHTGSDTPADVRWTGGGSAANTACWLAAAGVPAAFLGRIGDDVPGQASLDAFAASGVEALVTIDQSLPTGTCVVLVDQSGERTMVPSAGANAGLLTADVDAADFSEVTHLHVSGYALFSTARAAALHAIGLALAAGVPVSVGAASAAPLAAAGRSDFLTWSHGTTLFANRAEAEVLTGSGDPFTAVRALAAEVGTAIVTVGARGSLWSDGSRVLVAEAEPTDVLDSTGAGDAFAAGYLAGVAARMPTGAALANGSRLAAHACRTVGARPVSDGT